MNRLKQRDIAFSVIMPICNRKMNLQESIDSVINQTIGFKENIQLILVSIGEDNESETICLRCKSEFPDNIVYIRKNNIGDSNARNEGMKYVRGRYLNFFDSDDKWDINAFSYVYNFMESYGDSVDAVSCKRCLCGNKEGYMYPLDFKYSERIIIDIKERPDYIQKDVKAVFFRTVALQGMFFDEKFQSSKDLIFFSQVLVKKAKYGILPSAVCYYREHSNGIAIDLNINNVSKYISGLEHTYKELLEISEREYDEIIEYFQYMAMYDIQWRLKEPIPIEFTVEQKTKYIDFITYLIKKIDDKVILNQQGISFVYKIYALNMKYNCDIIDHVCLDGQIIKLGKNEIVNVRDKKNLIISLFEVHNGYLYIEGSTNLDILRKRYKLCVMDNKNVIYDCEMFSIPSKDILGLNGEKIFKGTGFKIKLPLRPDKTFSFILNSSLEGKYVTLKPYFGKMAKLTRKIKGSYYAEENYLIKLKKDMMVVALNCKTTFLKAEIIFIKNLIKKKKVKIAFLRILAKLARAFKRKEIWIISDRSNVAGDNGEALYKYIYSNKCENQSDREVYFMMDGNCKDYHRMVNYGKILKIGTLKHYLKYMSADKIISSHADEWVVNAYKDMKEYIKDMYTFDFVFLQHGVIHNDLSGWLNKQNKNIKLFLTSASAERDAIITGNYLYDDEVVKLTGLPRYDLLSDDQQKKVVFLPTWRSSLSGKKITGLSERERQEQFCETEYCKFYNSLINNDRVIKCMNEMGYTGEFYVHPAFDRQSEDFKGNDTIKAVNHAANYKKIFSENALLITDYSSVAFDFAYMKKPVIYAQFDSDEFYENHLWEKDYFDYEKDGFGPVCFDYETIVDTIIHYIENDCRMESKYQNRVDSFFYYHDTDNTRRVYKAIINMG